MVEKDYTCTGCGHKEKVMVPDDWKEQHMYLDCPACGIRVGLKMDIQAANIRKYGDQKGMSDWERIKNRQG
jgi:transcription elongation factor Elf1